MLKKTLCVLASVCLAILTSACSEGQTTGKQVEMTKKPLRAKHLRKN